MLHNEPLVQAIVFVLPFVSVLALIAVARAPKPPRGVELVMHVDRGPGREVDIVVKGTPGEDVEDLLAGLAQRIAAGSPATVSVERPQGRQRAVAATSAAAPRA